MAAESVVDVEARQIPDRAEHAPASLSFWIVLATAASTAVFTFGLLRALARSSVNDRAFNFSSREIALYVIVAMIGRIVSTVIQSEIVCSLTGSAGKLRVVRRGILVGVFEAQVPLAIRDVILGGLAIVGVIKTSTVIGLALSPLDPFMVVSIVVFYRAVRRVAMVAQRGDQIRAVVAFGLFLYVIKLALLVLGVAQ